MSNNQQVQHLLQTISRSQSTPQDFQQAQQPSDVMVAFQDSQQPDAAVILVRLTIPPQGFQETQYREVEVVLVVVFQSPQQQTTTDIPAEPVAPLPDPVQEEQYDVNQGSTFSSDSMQVQTTPVNLSEMMLHGNIIPPALRDPVEINNRFNISERTMNARTLMELNVICEVERIITMNARTLMELNVICEVERIIPKEIVVNNIHIIKRVADTIWNEASSDNEDLEMLFECID
ncbi:2163_t:CDS:2 [Acaulospora colombiana]|uniref:2163_t:CDS:1 n=1 Tax=Acaulospora colombiana TaxID=27376 RepID=A0ACA9KVK0_9GLOM|nr:2163_t:CDS:2 [Acaulospora colombiana]